MHQIEQALTKNSLAAAGVSILSSVVAKINLLDLTPAAAQTWQDITISWASDVGIVVGLLIACLTFVLKVKEFYEKFFYAGKKRRKPQPKPSDVPDEGGSDNSG